jgi:hypothetical protein
MSKRTAVSKASEQTKLDAELDRQLENTFPASDPPKIVLARSHKKPTFGDDQPGGDQPGDSRAT